MKQKDCRIAFLHKSSSLFLKPDGLKLTTRIKGAEPPLKSLFTERFFLTFSLKQSGQLTRLINYANRAHLQNTAPDLASDQTFHEAKASQTLGQ